MVAFNLFWFFFAPSILAAKIIDLLDPHKQLTKSERFFAGFVSGFLILGFSILTLALLTGNLMASFYIAVIITTFFSIHNFVNIFPTDSLNFDYKKYLTPWKHINRNRIFLLLILLMFFGVLFQVLTLDWQELPQGILVGWGDSAYHLDMIGRLAYSQPFSIDQPIAIGEPLTYSFFVNFISAVLLKFGLPIMYAWYIPLIIFGVSMIFLMYFVSQRILNRKILATILVFLVLTGGGFGYIRLYKDLKSSYQSSGWRGIGSALSNPLHQYTHLDSRTGGKPQEQDSTENIVWITPLISFFSHQRPFTAGMSVFLLVLLGWLLAEREQYKQTGPPFQYWLLFLGFLPLTHMHTLLAASLFFGGIIIQRTRPYNARAWIMGIILSLLIASPQLNFLSASGFADESFGEVFFKPWFGYMTCSHNISWFNCDPGISGTDSNALMFWLKNFGIVFLGWLVAVVFLFIQRIREAKNNNVVKLLIIPSILLFTIPNLFLLQPWEFDNNKVLLYWWLLAIILILFTFNKLSGIIGKKLFNIVFVLLIIGISLAGSVDISTGLKKSFLITFTSKTVGGFHGYYGQKELEASKWIFENTGSNEGFLSADGANNFIPMLTGRPLFLGNTSWLWTQGRAQLIDARQRIGNKFFESGNTTGLCNHNVRWLMWEPHIIQKYPAAISPESGKFGEIEFTQDLGWGMRYFIKLRCNN